MSIEFKKMKSHSAKWSKKYPRARINNKGGDRKAAIAAGWYKSNWYDDYFIGFRDKLVIKFLKANVGRPIDKVFSEFLEKCDSKLRKNYPLKEEFYSYIEKKEDIGWYGGFYITNGILNYKKREKFSYKKPCIIFSFSECVAHNEATMPKKKDIVLICEEANKTKSPQYLGDFYVYERNNHVKKSVYILDKEAYMPLFEISDVIGFGEVIGIFNFKSQSRYNELEPIFNARGVMDDIYRYKLVTKIKKEIL